MKVRNSEDDSTIQCPSCRRSNPVELIYCADPECTDVLHSGRITCGGCRSAIPVNAGFCPECGEPTGYEKES